MLTCDIMKRAEIDGIGISPEDRAFALSVTDALPAEMLASRLADIVSRSESSDHLRFLCVRNDSMDPVLFASAAVVASSADLGLVLESSDPVCIRSALESLPGRRPLMCVTDPDRTGEVAMLSNISGCPMSVCGGRLEELLKNSETASAYGASDVVLNPDVRNMKGCLETCTALLRLREEAGFGPADHPVMTRCWSGEYALSVASVAVLRRGSLVVLDDLDPDGCKVLDIIMD